MKRRVLLVDDEVAVLLTIKAVLEINDYSVDTATSAREGRNRIRTRTYDMIITDMRMESDASGLEVIRAARTATYQPAVALLTGFPVDEDDWEKMGDVQLLVKATGTQKLLNDLKMLLERRDARIAAETNVVVVPALAAKAESKGDKSAARKANAAAEPEPSKRKAAGAAKSTTTAASASGKRNITTGNAAKASTKTAVKKPAAKKSPAKKSPAKKSPAKTSAKKVPAKKAATKTASAKQPSK